MCLAPLFPHWSLMIITDSGKWNSKLETQLPFWWPQGFWEVQRAGKGGLQGGRRRWLGKRPAGLLMWGWGIECGGLRQPRGPSPPPCLYTLNTCLKPWRLRWPDHDKERLDELARLTFWCKPLKYTWRRCKDIFRSEANEAAVWLTVLAHRTYLYLFY